MPSSRARQHALDLQALDPPAHVHHGQRGDLGDAGPVELHVARLQVQPRAVAGRAGLVHHVFHFRLGEGLLAALVVVGLHRVVEGLALLARELHAGAHALRAPAVLAVVGEQARVQLRVAGAAHRAGAPGGEHLHLADVAVRAQPGQHRALQAVQRRQHMQHALAVLQRQRELLAQQALVGGRHVEVAHRQLDRVFLEAVDARKAVWSAGNCRPRAGACSRAAGPSPPARCTRPCG